MLYRGHPAKSRDAEAESLLGRRRALFCCAEAPKQTVCRLRRYGDPVRPMGRMHKAAGIWRSAPFLCAFTPHEFFCPEGLGKRQNTGRPLPCRVLRALSSAECEKSSRAKWPGSFCVDLTCGPQRTYSESAPPSCWNSRTHCRTRRRPSRRYRSEQCRPSCRRWRCGDRR